MAACCPLGEAVGRSGTLPSWAPGRHRPGLVGLVKASFLCVPETTSWVIVAIPLWPPGWCQGHCVGRTPGSPIPLGGSGGPDVDTPIPRASGKCGGVAGAASFAEPQEGWWAAHSPVGPNKYLNNDVNELGVGGKFGEIQAPSSTDQNKGNLTKGSDLFLQN